MQNLHFWCKTCTFGVKLALLYQFGVYLNQTALRFTTILGSDFLMLIRLVFSKSKIGLVLCQIKFKRRFQNGLEN